MKYWQLKNGVHLFSFMTFIMLSFISVPHLPLAPQISSAEANSISARSEPSPELISPGNSDIITYDYRPAGRITFQFQASSPTRLEILPGSSANPLKKVFSKGAIAAVNIQKTGKISVEIDAETIAQAASGSSDSSVVWRVTDSNGIQSSSTFHFRLRRRGALWHWPSEFETDRLDCLNAIRAMKSQGVEVVFARFGHFTIDSDSNGVSNDTTDDWDGDGINNIEDSDDDNDGIPDSDDRLVNGSPVYRVINYSPEYFRALKEAGFEIHLSYSFSDEFRKRYDFGGKGGKEADSKDSGACSALFIMNSIKANLPKTPVDGIQLDMEGLSDLDCYSRLISEMRNDPVLENHLFSVCPQTLWLLKRASMKRLAALCDFMAVMIYDHRWGSLANPSIPILGDLKVSSPKWIEKTIGKFDGLGIPFYAGIPSYDYIKVYDVRGKARDHWTLARAERSENEQFMEELLEDTETWKVISGPAPNRGDQDWTCTIESLRDTTVPGPWSDFSIRAGERIRADILRPAAVQGYARAALNATGSVRNCMGYSIFKLATTSRDELPDQSGTTAADALPTQYELPSQDETPESDER
ncbi:MAG: hypothetical protein CVV64_13595 [Candidatus Wallbacteria bacterium HGW-Wallbacteria-1]|jgi:hypothetical protein|uniref:Uncharacterized protein n=1 Tax=Candidatus Wallbacteria bacterium HGW-Wallbacteria-1 TaxID=2013854 RepID=A0A2N1PMN9_9BACT|nr:MAG: hypothetical protein CVV64_13595 [Candidatus Wallbacteria bacterium HGW-Wallbacteria-1]